jgi:signal transduction histidine kinase
VKAHVVASLWAEPRVPHPPARVWRDWVLVALLAGAGALETALRTDVSWRPVGLLVLGALAAALLIRRTHPFGAVALGFGVGMVADTLAALTGGVGPVSMYAMMFALVLPYSLLRWGSGREVAAGCSVLLAALVSSLVRDRSTIGELLIGLVFLSLPAVLGASVRFWASARTRELDQVRLREREQLARELHDTVAHHVSAMVIQAQAGRVTAVADPSAAVSALEIIEAEGSRTLAEMRTMVSALRDRDDAELSPQSGLAEVERLARAGGGPPRVDVRLVGELDDVEPAVASAAYRIAQESVTNATRHARGATLVDVLVVGEPGTVRVRVADDGDPVAASRGPDGYGLVGMRERAALLGGTLAAGPGETRGWVVTATLPQRRAAS